jgi:tetratricopeptide (TPR) repeat protein
MWRSWRTYLALAVGLGTVLLLVLWGRGGSEAARMEEGASHLAVSLSSEPAIATLAQAVRLSARATGGQGEVQYAWRVPSGTLEGEGAQVVWRAPLAPGRYAVEVSVKSGSAQAQAKAHVLVRMPAPATALFPKGEAPRGVVLGDANAEALRSQEERVRALLAKDEPFAHDEWKKALNELAEAYLKAGGYEQARQAYWRLLGDYLADDRRSLPYRRGYGEAAFFLGREDEALQALQDAGQDNTSKTWYYLGWLLEGRGRLAEAAGAYEQAARADRWFTEPLYRAALLYVGLGQTAKAVELLAWASPRLGRDAILERLATDPELAAVGRALRDSGGTEKLEEAREVVETLPPLSGAGTP